jgi:DNA replication protein DnaC
MMPPDQDLDALFERLHLANARRVWRDLVQRAERAAWAYRDFLTLLVTEEIAHRQQPRLARLTRRAHFAFLKTIDDFNFTTAATLIDDLSAAFREGQLAQASYASTDPRFAPSISNLTSR